MLPKSREKSEHICTFAINVLLRAIYWQPQHINMYLSFLPTH